MSFRPNVAIPRGTRIPVLQSPVRFHVFASKNFDLGRDDLELGIEVSMGLYSAERSIIDIIRLRHAEGSELAWEALRRWLRRRGSKPATLIKMASRFHGAERAVRAALEVVM